MSVNFDDDWKALKPPEDGCCICGVGGSNLIIGDTPDVSWRCQVCRRLVCKNHVLCWPENGAHIPHYGGREILWETLCSVECWEKAGRPLTT